MAVKEQAKQLVVSAGVPEVADPTLKEPKSEMREADGEFAEGSERRQLAQLRELRSC